MGRRATANLNLPPRMRARTRWDTTHYYYDTGGTPRKEIPLGPDYVLAVRKWSELHAAPVTAKPTVGWAIAKYLGSPQFEEVGRGTQADYKFALDKLALAFGQAPLDEVKPSHITLYIDKRSAQSKHRALREKAVLSMLFSWCMARDFCTTNPVAAIKTKRLPGRKNVYIEDKVFDEVYGRASQDLKDALDLAYLTGQRVSDVLKLSENDVVDGVLVFGQDKTGRPMRIPIVGDLASLFQRIQVRKRSVGSLAKALLVDELGKPMTKPKLRLRFESARDKAGIPAASFQFRDLRRKAAADLRDQGGIEQAQALLGHASVTMTEHYASGKAREVSMLPERSAKSADPTELKRKST